MGVNRGKWQQILGEDRKVGEGGMLSNMTSKQSSFCFRTFFAIMLNIEIFLNCCQKQRKTWYFEEIEREAWW
jgi:hypothetical protein